VSPVSSEQNESASEEHLADYFYLENRPERLSSNEIIQNLNSCSPIPPVTNNKFGCVNWTIQLWNQLPEDGLGALSCRPSRFRKRVRKVINKAK
jgi:hypothetical protein